MSTTLNHAMGTAKGAIGSAKEVIDSAKEGAEHAASSARSTFLDVAKLALSVVSAVRSFDRDDALGLVGLARKRSTFSDLPAFGAGVVVGAGVGLLFAPMSGTALRRTLLRSLNEMKREAGDSLEKAGNEVKAAEQKVEKKVGDAADAVTDAVKSTVEAAEEGVKEAFAEDKSSTSSKSASSAGNGHGEGTKGSKGQGGHSARSAS